MKVRLTEVIKTTSIMTPAIIAKWNTVITVLLNTHIINTVEITPVTASKYRFDMEGLFRNEFNIPSELIYPHIRVNGYESSNNYQGEKLRIKLIDSNILNIYNRLFRS